MILDGTQQHVVSSVIRAAEVNILLQTGMEIKLGVQTKLRAAKDEVYVLMGLVARALGMTMDDYFGGKRRRYADLRCLACIFIKKYYPETPLKLIAKAIGQADHTSVLYYQERAENYLHTKEEVFVKKYETVVKAIMK